MAAKPRQRALVWGHDETLILISVWRDNLDDLRRAKRNKKIYEKIRDDMEKEHGLYRTTIEVKNKITNLSRDYRSQKRLLGNGTSRSDWTYYGVIDVFLDRLPAIQGSANDDGLVAEGASESMDENSNMDVIATYSSESEESDSTTTPSSGYFSSAGAPGPSNLHASTASKLSSVPNPSRKRRKADNASAPVKSLRVLEEMIELHKQVFKKADDNDAKILQLMERQTEMQEKQIHLQEKSVELQRSYLHILADLMKNRH